MVVDFVDAAGETRQLTGKTQPVATAALTKSWVVRKHPDYHMVQSDEERQRASYLATRRHLSHFLVPHRHEIPEQGPGATRAVTSLRRSQYGYGIGLNKAYLADVLGHIRNAAADYHWGQIGTNEDQGITAEPTEGTIAQLLWNDATADNTTWTNFFEGEVLEWILSSVGGIVLIDLPPGRFETMGEALAAAQRPFVKFVPQSWMWDWSRGSRGYKWIKLVEVVDNRIPDPEKEGRALDDTGLEENVVLYELQEDGTTLFSRWNLKGVLLDEANVGGFVDAEGEPVLPIVEARFGQHPDVPHLGSGALMGLDDIVIDLYNLVSEIREAYRDAAFGLFVYKGGDFEELREWIDKGSRLVPLGGNPDTALTREAAEAGEVEAGLRLVELGIANWSLAAKRRAADAAIESAEARSGVALSAEFQLDLKPLLVTVTETLDMIETNVMSLIGQMLGLSPEQAEEAEVVRDTEFQLEQEASRISRIVTEFTAALPIPAEAKVQILMRWLEHGQLMDLDEELEMGDGAGRPLREVLEEEARALFSSQDDGEIRQSELAGQDTMAMMAEMDRMRGAAGGNSNFGGDDE